MVNIQVQCLQIGYLIWMVKNIIFFFMANRTNFTIFTVYIYSFWNLLFISIPSFHNVLKVFEWIGTRMMIVFNCIIVLSRVFFLDSSEAETHICRDVGYHLYFHYTDLTRAWWFLKPPAIWLLVQMVVEVYNTEKWMALNYLFVGRIQWWPVVPQ